MKSSYVRGLKQLAEADQRKTIVGLRPLFEHQVKELGATHQYRASKALRILVNLRADQKWEVVRFMKRGEKLLWASER